MRNTNCKETRRAVESFVMAEVDDILERCEIVEPLHPVDAAYKVMLDEMEYQRAMLSGREIVGRGIANMYYKSGRKYEYYTPAEAPYWVWSLAACVGCFDTYTDKMRDRLAEWLDETPEEASRYNDEKVKTLYVHLTAKAFERLIAREA